MDYESSLEALKRGLSGFGLDLPDLNFVQQDALYTDDVATIHEVDRTPVILDPALGGRGAAPVRCFRSRAFDMGGRANTDSVGRLVWKLSDFVCNPGGTFYSQPVSFVATAVSSSAQFLTTRMQSTGNDLIIDVFSWDTNGAPAPRVAFAWHCKVQAQIIVD